MGGIIDELLRVWGIPKVIVAFVSRLRKMGTNEQQLASDLDRAREEYERRNKKSKK